MEEDKKHVRPNAGAVTRARKGKAMTMRKLSNLSGVSIDTLKRMENPRTKAVQLGNVDHVATVLEVPPNTLMHLPSENPDPLVARAVPAPPASANADGHTYTFEELMVGAEKVAAAIYDGHKLQIDAVLTFPGPSSIFCGLVLAKLPPEVFICIPVYTAIFVDAEAQLSEEQLRYSHPLNCKFFKVLVPLHLIQNKTQKIIVIDDVIISGGFIRRMRTLFKKSQMVQFACCICYQGRTLRAEIESKPELVGLPGPELRLEFPMPWGLKSFSFEDIFHARKRMLRQSHNQETES